MAPGDCQKNAQPTRDCAAACAACSPPPLSSCPAASWVIAADMGLRGERGDKPVGHAKHELEAPTPPSLDAADAKA